MTEALWKRFITTFTRTVVDVRLHQRPPGGSPPHPAHLVEDRRSICQAHFVVPFKHIHKGPMKTDHKPQWLNNVPIKIIHLTVVESGP
ncbi:hypothetical protein NHX12_007454 [Muraenolepis orangiensis]|uniref:Uncharacterized protein n=1 Tax=Muraenolepis orangiensis TaxID=630683 RepID=A0A9Q0DQ24_9TELE|nr:hypothetical protein NHX12_007454 [Muraenolepis orangiensis]